jgi:hypothetical protein
MAQLPRGWLRVSEIVGTRYVLCDGLQIQSMHPFYCCIMCFAVLDAKGLINRGQPFLPRRSGMATLDEITNEKQQVSDALARVDAQREKLIGQLGELEAAERVLARYSKGTGPRRRASARAPTTPTKTTAPAQSRGRSRTRAARPAGGKRGSSTLGDRVLALATGKTQKEITAACKGARPNHVGAAIARHKRARRIEERDGKLYATQWAGT